MPVNGLWATTRFLGLGFGLGFGLVGEGAGAGVLALLGVALTDGLLWLLPVHAGTPKSTVVAAARARTRRGRIVLLTDAIVEASVVAT
jgi:hypothetical protein